MYVISQVSKFVPQCCRRLRVVISHYHKLALDDQVEIRKQSVAEEVEEPEPGPVEDHDGFEVE